MVGQKSDLIPQEVRHRLMPSSPGTRIPPPGWGRGASAPGRVSRDDPGALRGDGRREDLARGGSSGSAHIPDDREGGPAAPGGCNERQRTATNCNQLQPIATGRAGARPRVVGCSGARNSFLPNRIGAAIVGRSRGNRPGAVHRPAGRVGIGPARAGARASWPAHVPEIPAQNRGRPPGPGEKSVFSVPGASGRPGWPSWPRVGWTGVIRRFGRFDAPWHAPGSGFGYGRSSVPKRTGRIRPGEARRDAVN